MSTHKYYVYVFTDPRNPGRFEYENLTFYHEPFYVGKGKGTRKQRHLNKSQLSAKNNSIKEGKLSKIINSGYNPLDYCIIIGNYSTESQAIKNEIKTILTIGRIDLKTGPLANLTNGGEGMSGNISALKGKTYEEIYGIEKAQILKQKRSVMFTGKNNPMYGVSRKGTKLSDERKEYLSKIKRKPIYQICKKTGKIINEFGCAKEAAEHLGIGLSGLHNCLSPNNVSKSSAGFYWRYK